MKSEKSIESIRKYSKGIIDFYGQKFIYLKKILDLGFSSDNALLGKSLLDLGADVTLLRTNNSNLKDITKKFPNVKTINGDFSKQLPFVNQKRFDIIVDVDVVGNISNYEQHLKDICSSTTHLILESVVLDSPENESKVVEENSELSNYFPVGSKIPSATAIEAELAKNGMNYKMITSDKFNSEEYEYNWINDYDGSISNMYRRIWIVAKRNNASYVHLMNKAFMNAPQVKKIEVIPSPYNPVNPSLPNPPFKETEPTPELVITHRSSPMYDKHFVIVIPSFNNERYCEKNIKSALEQKYFNYRIIFTDDCSQDNTFNLVNNFVSNHPNASKCTLIQNKQRVGALENLYNMIHSCKDNEIVLTVDGDDWLPHNNVLNYLNKIYSTNDVWMTYGQYKNSTDGGNGVADRYPDNIVRNNSFRDFKWCASHLRTFYSWLFKNINKEDLMYEGKFLPMTWDLGMMFPMLEMAGTRSKFLSEILYTYNLENPINDHKVNVKLQQLLDRTIRKKPKYKRIEESPIKTLAERKNVGLILIATNKYKKYVQPLISSADKYFLKDCNVTYYLFSDEEQEYVSDRSVIKINIEHKPFPYASMDRFKHFTNNKKVFDNEEYLYYVDVDCLFVDAVDSSILSDLVGVQHCGYYGKQGTVEDNPKSCLYLKPNKYKHYFGGGFNGGSKDKFLELSKTCYDNIEKDLSNGIMPRFHDETSINFYFALNPPTLVLDPSYHYPQSNIDYYKKIWGKNSFNPKILLLDKNHTEVRS